MLGLGVLSNQPANPYQPPLVDGIHLRWAVPNDLGFPWHGFYLFRRPAQTGRPLCLSSITGGLKKGDWPENKHYTAIGKLTSDTHLVMTNEFAPANQVEFALDGRKYLRFDLPEGELARRLELRIGFRSERCLDFGKLIELTVPPRSRGRSAPPSATRPNPLKLTGSVTFEVKGNDGQPISNTQFELINTIGGPLVGLGCEHGLTIQLPVPCNSVELLVTLLPALLPANTAFTFEAFDKANNKVDTKKLNPVASVTEIPNQPRRTHTINLTGQNIVRIQVSSMGNAVRLHRICADNFNIDGNRVLAQGTVFFGTTPIRTFKITGQSGQIVSTSIEGDNISAVEIAPVQGSLVDLCYVPVAQGATQGWDLLSDFKYPMGLPVAQPDYPCSVPNPQSLLNRVHYQLPADWDVSTFTELHDQLVDLVAGGPNGAPMADRIFAAPPATSNPPDPNPPKLSTFHILDMVLLGSLHPALAQLVGLYWVDQTAARDQAYDYLIVADHTGAGQHDAATTLATIQSSGFTKLDGFIVFNKTLSETSTLEVPRGLQTHELPGGTFPDAQGHLPQWSNNAGLRWDVGWDDSGSLLPGYAVMYLIWRADQGNAATPNTAAASDLITKIPPDKAKPVLVTEPRIPNGLVPERSPDWPALPLHFIDRNLPDGWYSYEVVGVDLFGRHSPNSAPSQILVRDKIPPPMPTAVAADALDPDDPYFHKSDAYQDWYNSLDPLARDTLIGLRVRWIWTPAHQRQAPDTSEFRIYFHPSEVLPPDQDQALQWQDRYYVVGYNENFKIDPLSGDRVYEIFLPPATAPVLTSLPLNPSLTEPVVYAHIGVSAADDKTHTADGRTNGDWGSRNGNEGSVGAPARIYRVWRQPPPPPGDVFTGDRLFASPADYYDRSFFTYRWQPQQHLKLHVFRALDDAIFKADWSRRPSALPLAESQLDLFPAGWNQATRQAIAHKLNHLDSFTPVEDRTAEAMAYYRKLSDAALRVLAGLPTSESAFVQVTINPLDPNDNTNRLGPDLPEDFILDPNERAFIDTLDGRATNRYFYRAAMVDAGHNLGPLGLSSPPVYLPNVVPRQPLWTGSELGDNNATLFWVSNREDDLVEYQIFRADSPVDARDIRLMQKIHTVTVAAVAPRQRPATTSWTDSSLTGGSKYLYRIVAVDVAGNVSTPSETHTVLAIDTRIPDPPVWLDTSWVLRHTDNGIEDWPADGVIVAGMSPALRLVWSSETAGATFFVTRRARDERVWQSFAGTGAYQQIAPTEFRFYDDNVSPEQNYTYRIRVTSLTGVPSIEYREIEVARPAREGH